MSFLSREQKMFVTSLLVSRVSLRRIEEIARQNFGRSIDKKTSGKLLDRLGTGCDRLHNRMMRGLHCPVIQADEQFGWVHTRRENIKEGDDPTWGESWIYAAIDTRTRVIISYLAGARRLGANTNQFVLDIRKRVTGTPEVWVDGFKQYPDAFTYGFGPEVHLGRLVKPRQEEYEDEIEKPAGPRRIIHDGKRYSGAIKIAEIGDPDLKHMHTNGIERLNNTTRQFSGRMVRKTLSFSKALHRFRASISLLYGYLNWCWVPRTMRVTPCMELKLTDHIWSLGELIDAAENEPEPPPEPQQVIRHPDLPAGSRWHGVDADRIPRGDFGTGRTKRPKVQFQLIRGGLR